MNKNNTNKLSRDWNTPILESVSFIESNAPNKTGIAYKVFKVKNGKLYPPMVANPGNEDTPIGVWLDAQEGEFAGLSKTGRPQVKSTGSGNLAYRPGWHLGDVPRAKQFDRLNKETGEYEFPKDFVWAECEYAMDVDYQKDSDEQGYMRTKVDDQGNVTTYKSDKYQHSLAGLPRIPKDGYYRYRTNPNPDTVPWVITGKMKVNRLLSDEEVNKILQSQGIEPIHRQGGDKTLAELGLQNGLQESTKRKTRVWGNPLLESKEDRQKFIDWLKQEYEEELAINLCDNFIKLKNSIKSPYNDFYYWMKNESPKVFFDYMNELMNNYVKKQQIKQSEKDGARLVYSDNDWKVYEITTYEASAKYGKNTKWCIAGSKRWTNGENGNKYFSDYTGNGIRFYYFINKSGEKWALAVYPNDSYCEIYNAEDVKVAYIPNAPQIDEIKVNYNDHSDRNILVNAIMSGQIDEDILFTLMGEVIYDNMGFYTEIFNNPHELVDFLDENIPDGYLEHESVENGDLSVEDYEDMFDASYDEYWDGDLPQIDFNYDDTGSLGYTSKEALLKPENFNNHKYWFCIDYEGGEGWDITACDDYIKLYALCSEACAIDQWTDSDVDDFYEDSEIDGASRADIFGIMCANQLLWDIRNGKISKNVISNLGLSKDYLNNAQESLVMKEDLNGDIDLVSSSFGTSLKPFMGPSYILPNGEFLKIRNANINITDSGSGDRGLIIHLDVQKWLNKQHNKEVKNVDNIDLEEVCIRVNTDQLEHYIVLPKQRPNDNQFEALKEWIDFFYDKTNADLRLVSYYGPTITYFKGAVAEDIIDDIKAYYTRGMYFEKVRTKRKPIATLCEGYTPKEGDFPFTLEDIENKYPDLISNNYESCGNAFIMPDGRFILSGNRFETHEDFAWQCLMDIANMSEQQIEDEYDTNKLVEAFTIYFDLVRVNDGSNEGVEDRAYFVIPKNRISSSQQNGLLDYLDYVLKNKFAQKTYTIQAYVGTNLAHHSWDISKDITSDEILDDVKGALIRGYFTESLKEDMSDSDQEVLNVLDETFGQGDNIVDWSTYILPNGHCLSFFSNKINDKYLSDPAEDWFTEEEGEHARCWEFMTAMWPDMFETSYNCEDFMDKYCIKVNVNFPYVSLALNEVSPQQWDSLKEIMKCLLENPRDYYWMECPENEKGLVSILTKRRDTWLNLFELGLDEFMKEVQEGYVRGFFENLNEDTDDEDDGEFNQDDVIKVDGMYIVKTDKLDLSDVESYLSEYLTTECDGMNGPVYIFPDGLFIDIMNDYGDRYSIHYDIALDLISNFYNVDSEVAENSLGDVLDYLEENLGLIRCNGGEGGSEDRTYVSISKVPTEDQYKALEKYFYNLWQTIGKRFVTIMIETSGFKVATFEFDKTQPEDIIKAIRRSFVSGQLLSEKNYKTPEKTYDFDGDKVTWDKDAEDYIYWGSEADKWAEDYAKSYKVQMSPKDFLDLTTKGGANSLKVGDDLGLGKLRDLDKDEFNKWIHQPIFLQIAFRDKNHPQRAQVTGHEGRHRMFALMQAGYKSVDVELSCDTWDTEYNKYKPFKLDSIELIGQFNPNVRVEVYNPIPLSWKQHKSIRPELKDESLNEDVNKYYRLEIEDRYGDRAGLWTGAFELIPTKSTIEEYPEDFKDLTPDERRNYYQFDYLLNQLSKIKSPGVDTNFNGFRENDIFAFTSNKYAEIKDIIDEMKQVLKELGFKLLISELDIDDVNISYRDDDQVAFSKSNSSKYINESKEDWEKFKQWCGDDSLYNRFMKLRPRLANIKFTDGSKGDDIYFWMKHNTPIDLEDTLQDLEATPTKKEREERAQEGAKLLYNQNGWKVYKIETQEASQKYGKGSMWCISGEGGYDINDGFWNGHEDCTYFFIHGNEKYALIWHKGNKVWDIWNDEDEIIPYIPNAPKVDGLPDVSKLPDFIAKNVAKLYDISVDDIKDVKSVSYDPELMELFFDYDSKENYMIELKDGTTKYCYVEEFSDFVDVTEEIEELIDEYFN